MQVSHRVWLAVHGPGPWPCHSCGEPVDQFGGPDLGLAGIIHHEDRNRGNNTLRNLKVMHHACHVAEHQRLTHRDLASLIRDQIRAGSMARRMPSILKLSAAYHVAPMTVRSAINVLVEEGLVIRVPSRGTFVA